MNKRSASVVLTIGHSDAKLASLIEVLQIHDVKRVVDVRTIPRSRHNPQFNRETLPDALRAAGISYQHMPGLGDLRRPRPDSRNMAWRNASFRGFADYMQTRDFADHLGALTDLARQERVALMCAEAVPWRCHRSLIADALLARHFRVEHILGGVRCQTHSLTPWPRVKGMRITYPSSCSEKIDLALTAGPDR